MYPQLCPEVTKYHSYTKTQENAHEQRLAVHGCSTLSIFPADRDAMDTTNPRDFAPTGYGRAVLSRFLSFFVQRLTRVHVEIQFCALIVIGNNMCTRCHSSYLPLKSHGSISVLDSSWIVVTTFCGERTIKIRERERQRNIKRRPKCQKG